MHNTSRRVGSVGCVNGSVAAGLNLALQHRGYRGVRLYDLPKEISIDRKIHDFNIFFLNVL